ncbi:uncharacterized protein LOC122510809 [Leptopilina heterotoma]|uniref:uncharacterized protein LOC122510809 n=1 Tax=Leptopilina heterotoma TaxID=63436 RepID=UPI001CA8B1AF|nr:uncharacterized protein LOC122510809 [Leptopilina heterotoma]
MYVCSECGLIIPIINGLCNHLKVIHGFNVLSVFKCGQNGCDREYGTAKSFRKHLNRDHPFPIQHQEVENFEQIDLNNPEREVEDFEQIDLNNPERDIAIVLPVEGNNEEHNEIDRAPATSVILRNTLYNSSLALSAKLYSSNTLNRAQIQDVIDYMKEYSSSGFLEDLKSRVDNMLRDTNQREEDVRELNQMFSVLQNPFSKLETEYLRMNALEDHDCYIRPVSYIIGPGEKIKNINGQAVVTPFDLTGQHIPMQRVLKSFFELPGVLDETLNYIDSLKNSRKFTNIIQSPLWREIEETHFQGKTVFPLFLYFDDAEPDNQTGSHSGDHSIGAVYYEIPCIPQHLLSKLQNIFVSSIFLSSDRVLFNEEAFRPSLNDLKYLEETGILIQTEEGERRIFFALCLLLGDNKGFQSINGFVESFNANYYCRFCKEHRTTMRQQKKENLEMLRNIINYEVDLRTDNFSITGIKSRCIFNSLFSFHIVKNLMVDIMHDLFEGVCHYDLCAILDYLIFFRQFFTLQTLNERIQNFNYGPDYGNKPTLITRDHIRGEKLKMSASEMMFFVRNFGLMVGDLVPDNDEGWKLYKVLIEILDFVLAPFVINNSSVYLANLIDVHHAIYTGFFGNTLKPKHHFMVHYPRLMQLVGPLIHIWCFRFEGKHRPVIKQTAKSMTCRKNLPLSIAKRYALNVCAKFLSKTGFPHDIECKTEKYTIIEAENYENFQHILPVQHDDLLIVSEIFIRGTCYKQGFILAIRYENDLPLFGVIETIITPQENGNTQFILTALHTVGFNDHLHCYDVTPTQTWFLSSYNEVLSFHPYFLRTGGDGNQYISFKHLL